MAAPLLLDAAAELSIALTWGGGGNAAADADLQAVIVDRGGKIIDAVYYNNVRACGGRAAVHTGDAGGRAGAGREEMRFALGELPENVHMVFILVCSFTEGVPLDALGARLVLDAGTRGGRLWDAPAQSEHSGLLASSLTRRPSGWEFRSLGQSLPETRHFMDCLDELNQHIMAEIPTANRRQKVAFAMEKGSNLDFGTAHQTITLGLGWDVDQGKVDLDASAMILDASGGVLESIFFGNLKSSGEHSQPGALAHTGDNLTGEGAGDDEQIVVRLDALGPAVQEVYFCIHVYSKVDDFDGPPKTFRDVANPYCRVVDNIGGEELCRYTLREAGTCTGVVIARLRRSETDGRFGFTALGAPSRGSMYKDSLPDILRLSAMNARQLQQQG